MTDRAAKILTSCTLIWLGSTKRLARPFRHSKSRMKPSQKNSNKKRRKARQLTVMPRIWWTSSGQKMELLPTLRSPWRKPRPQSSSWNKRYSVSDDNKPECRWAHQRTESCQYQQPVCICPTPPHPLLLLF